MIKRKSDYNYYSWNLYIQCQLYLVPFCECFTFSRILIAWYYFQRVSLNSLEKKVSSCMCFYVKMDDFVIRVFFVCFFVCLVFFLVLLFYCKLFDETKFILLLRTFRLLQQSFSRTRFWMKNLHSVLWQWIMATRIP